MLRPHELPHIQTQMRTGLSQHHCMPHRAFQPPPPLTHCSPCQTPPNLASLHHTLHQQVLGSDSILALANSASSLREIRPSSANNRPNPVLSLSVACTDYVVGGKLKSSLPAQHCKELSQGFSYNVCFGWIPFTVCFPWDLYPKILKRQQIMDTCGW